MLWIITMESETFDVETSELEAESEPTEVVRTPSPFRLPAPKKTVRHIVDTLDNPYEAKKYYGIL